MHPAEAEAEVEVEARAGVAENGEGGAASAPVEERESTAELGAADAGEPVGAGAPATSSSAAPADVQDEGEAEAAPVASALAGGEQAGGADAEPAPAREEGDPPATAEARVEDAEEAAPPAAAGGGDADADAGPRPAQDGGGLPLAAEASPSASAREDEEGDATATDEAGACEGAPANLGPAPALEEGGPPPTEEASPSASAREDEEGDATATDEAGAGEGASANLGPAPAREEGGPPPTEEAEEGASSAAAEEPAGGGADLEAEIADVAAPAAAAREEGGGPPLTVEVPGADVPATPRGPTPSGEARGTTPRWDEVHDDDEGYDEEDVLDEEEEGDDEGGEPSGAQVHVGKGGAKGSGKGMLHVHRGSRDLNLDLKHRGLDAEGLRGVLTPALCRDIHDRLRAAASGEAEVHYINVDVSENDLGPEGTAVLVAFLRQLHRGSDSEERREPPVCVRALRMFRNRLGDEGAKHIAELVIEQPRAMTELHLSHNGITAVGAATIILAFGAARQAPYPFRLQRWPGQWGGCWLRLERNEVEVPTLLLEELKNRCKGQGRAGLRFVETSWQERSWGPNRSPSWASDRARVPHVILHMFEVQGRAGGQGWAYQGRVSRAEVREQVEAAFASVAAIAVGGGAGAASAAERRGPAKVRATAGEARAAAEGPSASLPAAAGEDGGEGVGGVEGEAAESKGKGVAKARVWKPKDATGGSAASASTSSPEKAPPPEAVPAAVAAVGSATRGRKAAAALERATEALERLLISSKGENAEMLKQWRSSLEDAAHPWREALHILAMAERLRAQGYPDPRVWAPEADFKEAARRIRSQAAQASAGPGSHGVSAPAVGASREVHKADKAWKGPIGDPRGAAPAPRDGGRSTAAAAGRDASISGLSSASGSASRPRVHRPDAAVGGKAVDARNVCTVTELEAKFLESGSGPAAPSDGAGGGGAAADRGGGAAGPQQQAPQQGGGQQRQDPAEEPLPATPGRPDAPPTAGQPDATAPPPAAAAAAPASAAPSNGQAQEPSGSAPDGSAADVVVVKKKGKNKIGAWQAELATSVIYQ